LSSSSSLIDWSVGEHEALLVERDAIRQPSPTTCRRR